MTKQPLTILCGMPRSGTTWLGKIFDSHPDTLYLHEPDSVMHIKDLPLVATADQGQIYCLQIASFVEHLRTINSTKVNGSLPIFPKHYYNPLQFGWKKCNIYLAKIGARVMGEFPVIDLLGKKKYSNLRLVWKSIESVGRLGLFARTIPDVRIIMALRHPCGYVSSVLRGEQKRKFTGDAPTSEDYGLMKILLGTKSARERGLSLDEMKKLLAVERLAWQWLLFNENTIAELKEQRNCKIIRYEDLCEAPQKTVRQLFSFAGLDWQQQTARFLAASIATENESYYSVYKNPRQAAYRWREALPGQDIDRILNIVRGSLPGDFYD